ncbi:CHAT domain-containing protein [Streptomyces sp. LRE541]|uniref:CHAT domain-containing protein n=1 Tax=Streptomyces sp. LRE541 TaxID=2931983 RepID=UPI00200F7CCC|nr:CHAT domain-containing protein [Streptomyces sp. LRE541]UPZ28980.1 CHAT domain-containing protein [Streptomyces sp. LRE541]
MSGEPPRGPRWLTGAGNVIRRAPLTRPMDTARRELPSLLHLRPSSDAPVGMGSVDARLHERLEDGYAVLRVIRAAGADGRDGYRFRGWCGDLSVTCAPGPTRLTAPAVGLGNLTRCGLYPSEILRGILHWSGNQGELASWINRLRARHGDTLRLIVWDETGYELPWEAFRVPPDQEHGLPGGLLGALLVLTRWTTVHDGSQGLPRPTGECHGSVLSYLHRDMVGDSDVFAPYLHRMYPEMTSFLHALDTTEQEDPTGLVYLGCHGTYGDAVMSLTLAERTWAEYNSEDMRVLGRDRSLVCLNACHSGRFVNNVGQGENALRGFAELFLRKGAGGCIVTAGEVGDHDARVLIQRLMRQVAGRPDLPVPESLRSFRAGALEDFGSLAAIPTTRNDDGRVDAVGQKRVMRLLYAFTFQYYGHPLTTLRLITEKGHSAWGEGS